MTHYVQYVQCQKNVCKMQKIERNNGNEEKGKMNDLNGHCLKKKGNGKLMRKYT